MIIEIHRRGEGEGGHIGGWDGEEEERNNYKPFEEINLQER